VVDDSDPGVESDLRRRAAWLLLMLAIVAVLLVVVISALVSTNNDNGGSSGPKALDPVATQSGGQQSPSGQQSSAHHRSHQPGSGTDGSSSGGSSTGTSSIPVGTTSCPTKQTCILEGDPGNAIQAINDFRAAHGRPSVPGSVTALAQTCAGNNGNGCTGGWAETELADPNGQEAVQKIEQFAHFEDPHLTSIEVGWAYDPSAKLYYFAIVRND
jgi:hypothetical protein